MITKLNIYNLDGHNNYFHDEPFKEMEVQLVALADKLNEVIDLLTNSPDTTPGPAEAL